MSGWDDVRCPNDGEMTNKRCWKCGWKRDGGVADAPVTAGRTTSRCTSCDHLMTDHQPEGCRRAVIVGTVGKDLVCPCVVEG